LKRQYGDSVSLQLWSGPMIASLIMLIAIGWLAYSAARAGQPLFGQVLED